MSIDNPMTDLSNNEVVDSYHYNDIEMECANQDDIHQSKRHVKEPKQSKPEPILKSKALRWHMPIVGEIPLSK